MTIQENTGHVMKVLGSAGHTTVTWDPDVPESCTEARAEFERLIEEGYQAFRMNTIHEDGVVVEEKGERITRFDPTAGRLMLVPHLRGG